MSKTIKDYEVEYSICKYTQTKEEKEKVLEFVLEKIKFLDSIYMTGGVNNHFSQEFKDLAYRERQQLCQESSALYNLLRN